LEKRIKLLEALKIKLGSYVISERARIPKYVFMCPIHGVVETTADAQDNIQCPHCKKVESRKNSLRVRISQF
jgi:hypothetical protein